MTPVANSSTGNGPRSILPSAKGVLLAPYAVHSATSRGRHYPEPLHPYRGPFQRDRDRIVHTPRIGA